MLIVLTMDTIGAAVRRERESASRRPMAMADLIRERMAGLAALTWRPACRDLPAGRHARRLSRSVVARKGQ